MGVGYPPGVGDYQGMLRERVRKVQRTQLDSVRFDGGVGVRKSIEEVLRLVILSSQMSPNLAV